jgi:pyruvate formate lyase activating enzyme
MGIHTALDSNGYYGDRLADDELEAIDVVLLDIKTWDPERHKKLTGMEPEPTRAFARRLAARKRTIWLRNVLVPGLTDDMADIAKIAEFAASLGNVERVDVLPFHQMGKFKYERLGIPYALADREVPTQELVDRAIAVYRGQGLTTY